MGIWLGQLPFLVHGQYSVASFGGIVKYVSGLRNADYKTYPDANLDVHLTASERAQKTAWVAHAESHLGDLVVRYFLLALASLTVLDLLTGVTGSFIRYTRTQRTGRR